MTVKLLVLYPRPVEPEMFERGYHGQHMPLMRRLVGPDIPLPTFSTFHPGGAEPAFYRLAEIHFPGESALIEYLRSENRAVGQRSSKALSTGGAPIVLFCRPDEKGV